MLSSSVQGAFVDLPPLSCGRIAGAAAIAVEESDSAAGQVLLLGGLTLQGAVSTVHLVDLATGVCTPGRPEMLHSRYDFAAAWLPDGRIVCAGGWSGGSSAEMRGPSLAHKAATSMASATSPATNPTAAHSASPWAADANDVHVQPTPQMAIAIRA